MFSLCDVFSGFNMEKIFPFMCSWSECYRGASHSKALSAAPFVTLYGSLFRKKTPSQPLAEFYCFLELIINNDYDVIY